MTVTSEQYDLLTRPIDESRIRVLKGNSHLEAWDDRRWLLRIFGWGGFDIEYPTIEVVHAREYAPGEAHMSGGKTNNRPVFTVVYRAVCRLTIRTPDGAVLAMFEDTAAGESTNQPSLGDAHDHASKTACSQALKRCCVNLGDQFGLSLYNGGRTAAVVGRSVVTPAGATAEVAVVDESVVGGELDEEPPAANAASGSQLTAQAIAQRAEQASTREAVRELFVKASEFGLLDTLVSMSDASGVTDGPLRDVLTYIGNRVGTTGRSVTAAEPVGAVA